MTASAELPVPSPPAAAAAAPPPLVQTFMTHRMSDTAILQLSTGREKEIATLRDALQRSLHAAPGALQHVVIYAPRGFGKSFMTRLVQIEAGGMRKAGTAVPFVLLPEEQHNLTRNPHALPDYIAHRLADLRTGKDSSWAQSMFQWPDPQADARHWAEAVQRLEDELDRSLPGGQGMAVVAIENFDTLLFGVFKDAAAEQRLRKWLDRPQNRLMLLATATGSVDMDYDRPLFQAFQPLRLEPWSPETCLAYFQRRREAEGKPPLDETSRPKARAVADFIGGNPRLAQLLADVLDSHDALSVAGTMDALADKLADYYRRRIDDLPPLSQGLLDALIRGGEPASQTELARRVGAGSQADIARTMQDLQRHDIVRGTPALDSRETLYRVTDRVFVHFYRVRQGQQQALRTPLASILDFLQAFYSRDEQRDQAVRALGENRPAEARLFADLARQDQTGLPLATAYVLGFVWRWRLAIGLVSGGNPWESTDLQAELVNAPEQVCAQARQWQPADAAGRAARALIEAQALFRLGLHDQTEAALTQALKSQPSRDAQVLLLYERAVLLWYLAGRRSASFEDLRVLSQVDTADAPAAVKGIALRGRAYLLAETGRHEEAVQTAREAAALAQQAGDVSEQADCLRHAAWSLGNLGRHEEAVQTAHEAAGLAQQAGDVREEAVCLRNAAWSLGQLGRHEKAVQTAQQAAGLAQQAGDVRGAAECLRVAAWNLNKLGRHEDALADALAGHRLALSLGDRAESARATANVLLAAAHTPSRAAVDTYLDWLRAETADAGSNAAPRASHHLDNWLAAVVRATAWEVIDEAVSQHANRLADGLGWFIPQTVGEAVARVAATEGRAAGYAAMRNLLPTLKRVAALGHPGPLSYGSALGRLMAGFAAACRDAGLLRDVAGLLSEETEPMAAEQAVLLRALADLDESPTPAAVLARADPDLAIWLRRMRQLDEPAGKVTKPRAAGSSAASPRKRPAAARKRKVPG